MVQYKRKPVKYQPPPSFLDDNTEIWVIEPTGEIFTDYERYLARRDFYLQKKFTCDATGHSGFNFFEALESEMESTKEIDSYFPEALRERVLNFVQFQNTPRMDDLVNLVFEKFKEEYIVGDRVVVEEHGSRQHGIIRDMTDPNPKHRFMADGTLAEPHRPIIYYVTLDGSAEEIIKVGSKDFCRDRKVYSKLVLKSFLRNAVSRETWSGAPWMVKEKLANQYKISMKVPETKTRDAVMAAKKAANAAPQPPPPAPKVPVEQGGTFLNFLASQNHPSWTMETRPILKAQKKSSTEDFARQRQQQGPFQIPQHQQLNGRLAPYLPFGPPSVLPQSLLKNMHPALPINLPFQNQFMQYQVIAPTFSAPAPAPPAPPPVKYPIEDLELPPRHNALQRPPLKFFSDDVPSGVDASNKKTGILMKSMGPLLCTWETLNVHDEVFWLDSFTFDDFVDAMRFSSEEVECELFVEIHCAILKQLVDENGKVQVELPKIEGLDDESGSENGTSAPSTPEPEIETKPPARRTRSSLAKSEAAALAKRSPSPAEPRLVHRAAEFLSEYDWIDRCKARDFKSGGWESMMVGLIYNVSFIPGQKDVCEDILAQLVPIDNDPTPESVRFQYIDLDVNLRIAALEIACMLVVRTNTFRESLSKASEDMTTIRKQKIDKQREKKVLVEELFQLDQQRKILLPANMPASPPPEGNDSADVVMTGIDEAQEGTGAGSSSDEEEPRNNSRKLRHTKSLKRKREEEEARKEKARKDKAKAAKSKQTLEWEKLLRDIDLKKKEIKDCEDHIDDQDNDLRETNIQRSKYLGKDRFMNRYYWFERNGMPYGGLPQSSTAEYGYANGRLWVQGPDKAEMEPLITEPILSKDRETLGITVPERREKEEGATRLENSIQWGYYDDPDDIDKLIGWLDEHGNREKVLRKELQTFREPIVEYMGKMKEHLAEVEKSKAEGVENATRVSTRTKTYVDLDTTKDQCLLWTNNVMREQFGHTHSEQVKPKKQRKGDAKIKVPVGKNGKPLTRQGTRYGKL